MCDIEAQKNIYDCDAKSFSKRLCFKTILHTLYFGLHIFVITFGVKMAFGSENPKTVIKDDLKWAKPLLFTNWNYMFQTVFLFLALTHDFLEWVNRQETAIATKIRYWRDVIFCGLVVPYTCFVFTMFWSLYAIDRELVFPRVYDVVVPWWFNQCVHSNILALLVIETFLQPRRRATNRKLELIIDAAVGILYAVVYYSIFFFAGRWLYNVFGVFTWWQVCLFQLLIWFSSYVFYEMQFPINTLIHGKEPEEENTNAIKPQQNGERKNGEITEVTQVKENGEADKNGEAMKDGEAEKNKEGDKNGVKNSIDFKTPPFSTKSWSLKYRSIRSQFENSSL